MGGCIGGRDGLQLYERPDSPERSFMRFGPESPELKQDMPATGGLRTVRRVLIHDFSSRESPAPKTYIFCTRVVRFPPDVPVIIIPSSHWFHHQIRRNFATAAVAEPFFLAFRANAGKLTAISSSTLLVGPDPRHPGKSGRIPGNWAWQQDGTDRWASLAPSFRPKTTMILSLISTSACLVELP